MRLFRLLLIGILLSSSGCTSGPDVVPETFKATIDPSVTYLDILNDPTRHQGAVVLLGGEVLSAKRLTQGTRVEILQLPLNGSEEPVHDVRGGPGGHSRYEGGRGLRGGRRGPARGPRTVGLTG